MARDTKRKVAKARAKARPKAKTSTKTITLPPKEEPKVQSPVDAEMLRLQTENRDYSLVVPELLALNSAQTLEIAKLNATVKIYAAQQKQKQQPGG